jgi:hypothetical protein
MFELVIGIIFAFAIGPSPGGPPEFADPFAYVEDGAAAPAPAPDAGAVAGRAPDPQEPTGQFTTATEVRPIIDMTQANWLALRDWEGEDWLYFTHLLSWRCGMWEIRYGLNGAPATEVLPMQPCLVGSASPNAITDDSYPIYLRFPAGSVDQVSVVITYNDGTETGAAFQRAEIMMP